MYNLSASAASTFDFLNYGLKYRRNNNLSLKAENHQWWNVPNYNLFEDVWFWGTLLQHVNATNFFLILSCHHIYLILASSYTTEWWPLTERGCSITPDYCISNVFVLFIVHLHKKYRYWNAEIVQTNYRSTTIFTQCKKCEWKIKFKTQIDGLSCSLPTVYDSLPDSVFTLLGRWQYDSRHLV